MKWILLLLTIALIVLHQDFWNWDKVDPRLFGFLPIGLAYHAGFAAACAVLMGLFVKFAWPAHLENVEGVLPSATNSDRPSSH